MLKEHGLKFLNKKMRTVRELEEYLKEKFSKRNSEELKQVIEDFKLKGYLDDKKYIEEYISSKKSKDWSVLRLKNELLKKGIKEEDFSCFLQKEEEKEVEKAVKIGYKRYLFYCKNKKLQQKDFRKKLYFYLLQKGFSSDNVLKAIARILA